jgi:hypothetical protein
MAGIAWANRDNAGYGWKVLSRGVCRTAAPWAWPGLHDWTIDGVHLCMTRLNLLRLNTMRRSTRPASPTPSPARDAATNSCASSAACRCPAARARRTAASADHLGRGLRRIAARIRGSRPQHIAFFLTARALTNEVYYVAQKVARFLGTNNIDNAARLCHSPSTGAMKRALGVAASTCSYRDWCGTDLIVFFGSNPANDQPVAMKYLHEAKPRHQRRAGEPAARAGMERYWVPSTPSSALFGTDIADYWFGVAQRGDIAFL